LVAAGKVLYWGFSDTPAWVCAEAHAHATARGWAPVSAVQVEYNLIERTAERELLPFADHHAIGVTGSIPLAGGLLSGKHSNGGDPVDTARGDRAAARRSTRNDAIVIALQRLAKEIGMSPAQLALGWITASQPSLIPILGARTADQVEHNLRALDRSLDPEILNELSAVSEIDKGFPHNMLAGDRMREVMYGPFLP
jgi:aryl-alcohol dehydrogenase-like predicted oxidoreductase